MDMWLIVAVLLYLLCAALLVAEVFVPSGGLLTILALASLGGGLYLFFRESMAAGYIGIIIAVVMIPVVLILAYKIFPNTPFGRRVMLSPPERDAGDAIADTDQIKQLLGKEGTVTSPLRPVGMCEFDGRRIECVAEAGYIEKGKTITVIHVEGTQLTVRPVEQA